MSTVLSRPFPAAAESGEDDRHAATSVSAPSGRIGPRLIPLLLVCDLAALIDRLDLGFAELQFLSDLHLDEAAYGVAAGVLHFGCVIFEVPGNILLTRMASAAR